MRGKGKEDGEGVVERDRGDGEEGDKEGDGD